MTATASLLGRESETTVLDNLIDNVRGHGAALVVRGEPGIGKSALLTVAAERAAASGMRVLRTSSIQSEEALAFSGLHQLLLPVLGQVKRLVPAQQEAVLAAFGMTDEPVPNLFLTALATLELLADVASRGPVLVLADDAHWTDRATADVVAFVARRIESEPILVVAAIREATESPLADAGLPTLHLQALDPAAATGLLKMRAPGLSKRSAAAAARRGQRKSTGVG